MNISRIRKYFVVVFSSVLFVVLAVLALVVARGNIITNQGLVETGSIRLNVSPSSDYQVFLNEQSQTLSNNSISNITPGTFELKIDKQGYTSWHQSVDVKAGLVTDVTVQLFPQELKLEQLSKTNVDKTFFSTSHHYVYYSVTNVPLGTSVGIWKQTLQQSNIPLIDESPLKITDLTALIQKDIVAGTFTIKPSQDDTKLLLITTAATYVLDATSANQPSETNRLQVSYPVDEVNWLRPSSDLLIRSGNLLIDYNLDNKSSTIITYEVDKAPIYTLTSDAVLYLQDGKLYKFTPGSNSAVVLENVTLPASITSLRAGFSSDTDLVMQAGTKLYYLSTVESSLTELGDFGLVTLSPNGRNLMVSAADGTIYSLEINISLVQNSVDTIKRTTGITSKILVSSILWDPSSNYLVFQNSGENDHIYSADSTGNNINALLVSASIPNPGEYGIPTNNSGLVIKLFDSQQTDTTEKRSNLYSLAFNQ